MKFIDVASSNVQAIAWEGGNLYVKFISNNSTYCYYGVPEARFHEMLNAPSKGRYLHQNIKGRYHYIRIA